MVITLIYTCAGYILIRHFFFIMERYFAIFFLFLDENVLVLNLNDDLVFYIPSDLLHVFTSYRDDGRMIMKGFVQ